MPEIVLGRVVAITAFDGGPLSPSAAEAKRGWTREGDVLWTSRVDDPVRLPICEPAEWYVFDARGTSPQSEIFACYGGFRLDDTEELLHQNPTWERQTFATARGLQQLFWEEIERVKPTAYLSASCGDFFHFVSRAELFRDVPVVVRALTESD